MTKVRWDPWQWEFLKTIGDKILCTGRQVGKSEVCGADCGEWSVKQPKDGIERNVLMMAPTERQAYGLFDKTFSYLLRKYPKMIAKGKDKPTKTKITLTNGVRIYCLPVGLSGLGIRFLTIHRLYADEASRIPEEVWIAVRPAMLTTGADSIYLSTPAGPDGEFARTFKNEKKLYNSFTRFNCSSEKVIRDREICDTWTEYQRKKALELLEREKGKMSKLQYAQEFEGKLLDELKRLFSSKLIKSCMTIDPLKVISNSNLSLFGTKSLGADIAREGGDEFTIVGLHYHNKQLTQIELIVKDMIKITQCARDIEENDNIHNYKKLFIDDGGLGCGVVDILLETEKKRKVVAINNASRTYEKSRDQTKHQKKLMKEQIYNNLLALMEKGLIKLYKDDRVYQSLRGIQAEWIKGKFRIFGKGSHVAEALVRAAWIVKEKGLNIWIA